MNENQNKLTLAICVGISGSGKTRKSKELAGERNWARGSSDEFRAEISGDENNQSCSQEAFSALRNLVNDSLKNGKSIIVDATNLTASNRNLFFKLADIYGAEKIAYCFNVDLAVAKQRNKSRDRVVPDWVLERQQSKLSWPTAEEGCQVIWVN